MQNYLLSNNKVKIISSDNMEFIIDANVAFLSETLEMFFNPISPFKEARLKMVRIPMNSKVLIRIIEFMEYKFKSLNDSALTEFKISDEETSDLLDAAAYLRV